MSKLAYVFISLVGAVPAGGTNYLIVKYFLDHGFAGSPIVVAVCGATWAATFLTALTPLMVLIWYKAPQFATGATSAVADKSDKPSQDKKAAKGKKSAGDGFDDAIPDDFDEEELAASTSSDDEYAEDDYDAGDEDFDYADDEFEEEEEEEVKPKKKKKK